MLFIFISVIILTCLLAGWGALCVRFIRIETDNPWLHPFLGMLAAGTAFSVVSMFLPLNGTALIVFILAGLTGLFFWTRVLKAWCSGYSHGVCLLFLVLTFACTLLLAARCGHTEWISAAYDTDLYHANIVRWLNEYGTPKGLANLHTRLGNNSIWLTLAALFDNGYWDNRTAWIMPTLSALCITAYLLYNVLFSTAGKVRLFCGCMLFFTVGINIMWSFPNLFFDFPALFINVIVFVECLARAEDGWKITPRQASLILCLAALAFAIKPIAGVSVLFAMGITLYGLKKSRSLSITHLCVAFLPAAVVGIVWMARNSLLSGYPLFPLPFFSLPMDWTTPKEMVVATYQAVIGWARSPGPGYRESLNNWNWIVPWVERQFVSRIFWLSAGLPLLAAIPLWIKILCQKQKSNAVFFAIWTVLCLCYWFFSAPDLRFGVVFFQIFFALGLAFALHQAPWLAIWKARYASFLQSRRLCVSASAVVLLIAISASARQFHFHSSKSVGQLYAKRSAFTISGNGIPSRELLSRPLDTSVSPPILLFFPVDGDQCGNSPLPCTPYDNPRLRLRLPGNLGGGFYIE